METFTESLSTEISESQQLTVPLLRNLIIEDQEKAKLTIQTLLSSVNQTRSTLNSSLTSGPAHPYYKMLEEYLGKNYICPTIHDLALPTNFCPIQTTADLAKVSQKYTNLIFTQFHQITAEAFDTNFPGITSQHLGHAFATLSATTNGQEMVIDRSKVAKQLTFAEVVRGLPVDYIIQNPIEVAQKLLSQFVSIHKD
jgi:hypothetical protein